MKNSREFATPLSSNAATSRARSSASWVKTGNKPSCGGGAKGSMKYELPLSPENCTVLGYPAWRGYGAKAWNEELDWRGVRIDHGGHALHPWDSDYLHVRVKYSRSGDGPYRQLKYRRWYRVRCRYEIGMKYKRREVTAVTVFKGAGGKWYWLIETK